jgi:hypothetical protein
MGVYVLVMAGLCSHHGKKKKASSIADAQASLVFDSFVGPSMIDRIDPGVARLYGMFVQSWMAQKA